ncbi:MAG: bifunctional metallophosphatase/5'-nucleotidase [Ilumatobacter sp.]
MTTQVPAPRVRSARRRAITSLVAAGTVASTVAIVGASGPSAQAAEGDTVQILSFNDYHGHVEGGAAGSIGDEDAGGGEFLSAKLTELRAASEADASFTVAAGDNIGGTPFFSGIVRDEPSVESLNEMGLDISGVGNHEFDDGGAELLRMQNGGCFDTDGDMAAVGTDDADDCFFPTDPYAGADFQWLAANVTDDLTGEPLDLDDAKGDYEDLGGYSLVEVNGGGGVTEIAFIGMTLDGTDELVSASGIDGYTFEDEVTTANNLVTEIQTDHPGVESIFVLLHEGGIPTEFAIDGCEGVSGPIVAINEGLDAEIDGVISGHTQQPYNCELEGRPVISAWEHGKVVSEMTFDIDDQGDVDRSTLSVVNHPVIQSELTADPAITAVIDKWSPIVDDIGEQEVGRIAEDITRGGTPTGSDRGVESSAGNLIADAQLFGVNDAGIAADIAFMNAGGIRSDLTFAASAGEAEDGIVTYAEAFTFQPFNNSLSVLPMTGAQIKQVLVEQCQPGDSSRPVLFLGVSEGFTYDLDLTTQGTVCTDIAVSNVQLDGVDIDDAMTYNVAVNNFLADGGDSFDTFAEVAPGDRLPGPTDLEALIDYFEESAAPLTSPGTDRVTETLTTLPAPQVSVTPGRLLDTRTGPNSQTVDDLFEGVGRLAAGEEIELQVGDRGGVPASASAAVLNIGMVNPSATGFLTVYPCDAAERPTASSLNADAGDVRSNAVFAQLSSEGTTCIYSSVETDVYADVNSAVPANGSPTPVLPARLIDTRTIPGSTTIDGDFQGGGPVAAGTTVELQVTGRGAAGDTVDTDAVSAVLNVGAINAADRGFLTIYPCGETRPLASSLNYDLGRIASNSVSSQIGEDGKVCIYTSVATNLIADINAFVPLGGTPEPLLPARLVDTRTFDTSTTIDGQNEGDGPLAAEETLTLTVAGRGGVGPMPETVILNAAAIRGAARGFLTVYPCDEDRPLASTLNYEGGDIIANSVVAKVSADGTVCIYTSQETELIVDVTGSIDPVVPFRPAT